MKVKEIGLTALVAGSVLAGVGCSNRAENRAGFLAGPAMGAKGVALARVTSASVASDKNAAGESDAKLTLASLTDATTDRYLIKNGSVTVETKDVKAASQQIISAARSLQGYVSSMQENVDGLDARSMTIQVRVPFRQFDAFVSQTETLGKTLDKSVTAEDVTEEFVDTQSKTRNLKATESRLLAHLSKTGKLGDTLLVEKELNRVRQEIEQLEGRLRFLAHRISFSTLDVTLREAARPQAITPPETFSSGKVASDALRSLVGFGQNVWSTLIWVGLWSVVWLPIVLLVRFRFGRGRRVLAKSRSAQPPVAPTLSGSDVTA